MPDKIVNHFVLADGSVARYDYDGLLNVPFGDDVTEMSFKTRAGYIGSSGNHSNQSATEQELYTNKLPCFSGDVVTAVFTWNTTGTNSKWVTIAYYDISGRFLSRSSSLYGGTGESFTATITIPSDTYYFAFSYRSYGNCSLTITYEGSVYDIRNRIDRGLVSENLNGGFDYCQDSIEYYQNGEQVLASGYRVISDISKVPETQAIVIKKSSQYASVINASVWWLDINKNLVRRSDFASVSTTGTRYSAQNGEVYYRVVFDGANTPNGTTSPTADVIEQYIAIEVWDNAEQPLTAIICGQNIGGNFLNYPSWDTVNDTFTVPYDTIFFKNGAEVRPSSLMGTSTETVIPFPTNINSSALRLYFNIANREYYWRPWNIIVENYNELVLVATFRKRQINMEPAISINSPYYIDGKMYGIDLGTNLYDSVAWAFNENVKGVNHRGYYTAPENTLPAYKLSKQVGFKYCECDVSMTSDRVPVLLHDDTINRTARNADGTEISETISIGSITYEQALQYDFGIYKGSQYAGTKIPTFEQFVTLCRNLGLHPYIELKSAGGYSEAEVQNLVNIVKQNGMNGKVTWISFSDSLLAYVKNYDASARLGYVVGALTSANITTASSLKTATNEVFLDVSSIADDLVDDCITAGLPVEVWTIGTTSGITALNDYISGVTSDNLIASKVLYEANI